MEKHVRHRVNVSTSTKGVKTFDCTAEITYTGDHEQLAPWWADKAREETLAASDALVAELDKRYPAVEA